MTHLVQAMLALLLMTGCSVSVDSGNEDKLPPAVQGTRSQNLEAFAAAKKIVHAIDREEYSGVWDDSSDILKESVSKFAFTKLLMTTRGNLGKPSPRGNPRIGFSSMIDRNAPTGDYCILIIDTDFNGTIVAEKLVMQRVSGKWKLAGYFMSSKATFNTSLPR